MNACEDKPAAHLRLKNRMVMERKLAAMYLPYFRFCQQGSRSRLEGRIRTSGDGRRKLRLVLHSDITCGAAMSLPGSRGRCPSVTAKGRWVRQTVRAASARWAGHRMGASRSICWAGRLAVTPEWDSFSAPSSGARPTRDTFAQALGQEQHLVVKCPE